MKLKKKLVKALVVAVIGLMSVTSFANDLPTLTLEQAVSSALSADAGQQEAYEKSILASKQALLDGDDVGTSAYQNSYYSSLETEQVMKYHKDAVAYDATKQYNNIALLRKKLEFFDEKIPYEEKVLKQEEVKYQRGLLSKIDFESDQKKLETEQLEKEKMQNELDESIANFKVLTKYDVKNYSLEENFEVEYYHYSGNIQYFFNSTVDDMLQYQKLMAENTDNYLFYDMMKRKDTSVTSLYNGKAQAAQQANTVETTKDTRVTALNTLYSNLTKMEKDIKELENEIKDDETKLEAQKLKLNLGKISQAEMDKAEMAIKEKKLKLLELKVGYNNTKDAVRKPWVNFY